MILSIPIENKDKLLIKQGQSVDMSTPLYKKTITQRITLSVARQLEVSPKHIFRHMVKYVGDTIEKGETVAMKKGLFGSQKIKSPQKGILQEIDHSTGTIIITATSSSETEMEHVVYSYFAGVVEKINLKDLQLKVHEAKQYELKMIKGSKGGRLVYIKNDEDVSQKYSSAFIVKEKLLPYDAAKYDALGASGIVSIHLVTEETELEIAVVKQLADWEDLIKHNFPYCILDPLHSKIIAYK